MGAAARRGGVVERERGGGKGRGGAKVAQGMQTDLAVEIERDCKRNDQRRVDDLRACASTRRYRTDRIVQ